MMLGSRQGGGGCPCPTRYPSEVTPTVWWPTSARLRAGPTAGTCARPKEPGPDANACRDGECREPRLVEGASLTGEDEAREQGGQRAHDENGGHPTLTRRAVTRRSRDPCGDERWSGRHEVEDQAGGGCQPVPDECGRRRPRYPLSRALAAPSRGYRRRPPRGAPSRCSAEVTLHAERLSRLGRVGRGSRE
jgi:hypothetical protein